MAALISQHGRGPVTTAIRLTLADLRAGGVAMDDPTRLSSSRMLAQVGRHLSERSARSIRRVFNLTGTVLHTGLGRAILPASAIAAMVSAAEHPCNLEYDLQTGSRGDRDTHVEAQLRELTGAAAATVVNNNAAAVLLVLNSLARRREVPTSRGELVEIGGSFRLPEIMSQSGCRLIEIGTTNRTHLHDYEEAIGPRTALVMKAHPSNFAVMGFTQAVPERDLARLCRRRGVPLVVDLGSGTLADLRHLGLPPEPLPGQSLDNGASLVTFSGDKLLGGPQAGIIVGDADLIAKIKRNPLRRALRVDKITLAALAAVLELYFHPERLAGQLPVLKSLTRPLSDIRASAARMRTPLTERLDGRASVALLDCESEVGSGSLPLRRLASAALAIRPAAPRQRSGRAVTTLAAAFRALPIPVIGRVRDGQLLLDMRCLDDEDAFVEQLCALSPVGPPT